MNQALSDEIKDEIDTYIPYDKIEANYNPRVVDPVKRYFNVEAYNEKPFVFYKLWFKLFIVHPDDYISSFLSLNLPFWYPDACSKDKFADWSYLETAIKECDAYTFSRPENFPFVLKFYQKVANFDLLKKFPLITNIFSIATPIWVLLASLFMVLLKKEKNGILILAPQLLLWLTYLAGPVSYFRYIFPLFALYPITFALLLDPQAMLGEPNDFSIEKKETGL